MPLTSRFTPPAARPAVEALEDRRVLSTAQFVSNLYTDLLNRTPSRGELVLWLNTVNRGTPTLQVTTGFVNSDEFLNQETVANYQSLLGRSPSAAEAAFWLNARHSGVTARREVAQFFASDDYYARNGSTPNFWLSGVFRDVFGRAPTASEDSTLTPRGLTSYSGRLAVALSLATGGESNNRTVDAAYVRLLGRGADPAGLNFWSGRLAAGLSPSGLLADLAASAEFINSRSGGLDVVPIVIQSPDAGKVFAASAVSGSVSTAPFVRVATDTFANTTTFGTPSLLASLPPSQLNTAAFVTPNFGSFGTSSFNNASTAGFAPNFGSFVTPAFSGLSTSFNTFATNPFGVSPFRGSLLG